METKPIPRIKPEGKHKPTREVFRAMMLDYLDELLRADPGDIDTRAIRADVLHPVRGERLYQA